MNKKNLISNLISMGLMGVLLFIYIYTYHQLQASYGIGLYFAIKANATDNRLIYDLGADFVRVLLLLLLTLAPSVFTRRFAPTFLLRRLSLLVAVAPTISLGCFIGLFNETHLGVDVDFFQALLSYVNVFKFIIPMMCISLMGAYKANPEFKIRKFLPFIYTALGCFVLSLCINKFFEPGVYATSYTLIMLLTIICETVLNTDSTIGKFDILYLFLYLSAMYKLVDIAIHVR